MARAFFMSVGANFSARRSVRKQKAVARRGKPREHEWLLHVLRCEKFLMASIYRANLFANTTAVVTGGGSGIGKAIAKELLGLGGRVVLAARNTERLTAAVAELQPHATAGVDAVTSFECNIREEANVDGTDEWLHLVNVRAANKPVWANRVLKANKSDTCVANTSNATPNTQKKESGNADMGRILNIMRKGDNVKKHETDKPKAAAEKGAKDKKDTNLQFPSLGMLIESQISFAEETKEAKQEICQNNCLEPVY